MPSDRSPENLNRLYRRHKKDIEKNVTHDEEKERKKLGKVRRALKKGNATARERRVTEDNWEQLLDQHGRARRRASKSELLEQIDAQPVTPAVEASEDQIGIVMSVASARCRVFRDGEALDCTVAADLAVRQKSVLAVGDRAVIAQDGDQLRVDAVLPRTTVLARPDPLRKQRQRLVAANVDVVIHVVSLKAPALRPRLIDRYLIAIQRGGAQPVICVNKIDLLDADQLSEELERLAMYGDLGVPVIPCSSKSGVGLDLLRQQVEGRMAALVGHSGVGKSSILNALDESLQLATAGLHRKRGTGRHTTSSSTLYDFGGGTYLIDTPGIREFGLWDLDRSSLRTYFPEFDEPSESCRFTDCSHVHEPDCEVQRLVEEGELHEGRYDTYVRLWEDLAPA